MSQMAFSQIDNSIFSLYPSPYYKLKPTTNQIGNLSGDSFSEVSVLRGIKQRREESVFITDSLIAKHKATKGNHWGFLHYNKDNEYLQRINPGETFFGNQLWGFTTLELAQSEDKKEAIHLSIGGLVKIDFGGYESKIRFNPLMQIVLETKKGKLIAGSLYSQTQHKLPEPMINYDLAFKRPVEYGTQVFKTTKHWDLEAWLDWRQLLDTQTFRQEIISFGTRIEYQLFESHKHAVNVKLQGYLMLMHKGGEGFRYFLPLANRSTYSGGFTIYSDRKSQNLSSIPKITLNCWAFYQKDFSPVPAQPMKEGTAVMVNLGIRLTKNQQIILSGYQANKFTSPLGAPFYQCVNESNPIYFNPVRKMISARYVQRFHLVSQHFQLESRLEPIFDFDQKFLLYSLGLYLKYSI